MKKTSEQIRELEKRIEKLEKKLGNPVLPVFPIPSTGSGTWVPQLNLQCLHNGCKPNEPCNLYCPHCSPIC